MFRIWAGITFWFRASRRPPDAVGSAAVCRAQIKTSRRRRHPKGTRWIGGRNREVLSGQILRARIRGLTLAEMLIATSVLGLLSAVCLSIYSMGIRAWLKADSRTEVMSILQTAQDRIATEVRSSQFPSVSTMPDKSGVAFLSAGEEWSRQVDPGGRLQWTNFVYFYSLPSDEHLYRTEVGYAPADPTLLSTLEAYSGSPLSSHKVGGQAISRNLNKFEAELQSPDLLRVILRAKVEKEEMELESCYRLTPQP